MNLNTSPSTPEMFNLIDIFKLSAKKQYWWIEYRSYIRALKDPSNDELELFLRYKESIDMVNLSKILKKQMPKRYFTRINNGNDYAGPFLTEVAAHNRAKSEKNK